MRPRLAKAFALANPHQVPRISKVVLNVGMGDAGKNPKQLDAVVEELAADHRPEAGDHPGQEVDRELRPPRRHAGRAAR